ncbi:MAG: nucleotidyltransferase domain-containing protein [Gammaproteobacteria bacterium]
MSTHFYAFGSICRGETDPASDIDLLACISTPRPEIDPKKFSIYTYERIEQLWREGNPFAWHLHLESRLIFSSDGSNFLVGLGVPSTYARASEDCMKFRKLFSESYHALTQSSNSVVFHLSCMFLATRNFATCYSFATGQPIFSRKSPLLIDRKLPISDGIFDVFARARILSTRGYGPLISESEVGAAKDSAPIILDWMHKLSPTGELA